MSRSAQCQLQRQRRLMTAAVAMRKVWERHHGQIRLLFCDGHVEVVSSGNPFYERRKNALRRWRICEH